MVTLNLTRGAAVVLNYTNPNALKYFYNATKGVDNGNKYDLSPDELKSFLDQVDKRAPKWTGSGTNLFNNCGRTSSSCRPRSDCIVWKCSLG
jgi:hypothetical protein